MTTVKLCKDRSRMVYLPAGSSDLFLILSCLTSNLLVLGLFHLAFFLWGTNDSVFARLNKYCPEALCTGLDIKSQQESLETVKQMKDDNNFITCTRSSDKISKLNKELFNFQPKFPQIILTKQCSLVLVFRKNIVFCISEFS